MGQCPSAINYGEGPDLCKENENRVCELEVGNECPIRRDCVICGEAYFEDDEVKGYCYDCGTELVASRSN